MPADNDSASPKATSLRAALRFLLKLGLTIGAFYLLFSHSVTDAEGKQENVLRVILGFLPKIDKGVFFRFVFLATGVKLVGILASMYRWQVLLEGQGVKLPFRHIFGSFLIGRFLGTFLPSTIGLDGYKLYDAARFSGRSVEASGATLVEKVLGFTGIFLTYLVALPFGVSIFGERAGSIALLTLPVALFPLLFVLAIFLWPGPRVIDWLLARVPVGPYSGFLTRLGAAVTAYGGKTGVIALATVLSFVVHFTTAAMYFFTALAIGVTTADASFWQVTFASAIQILATVLSPFTIAGEGIREIAQYYLLGHLMGPAEAIVSAALGFWAAEALTLFGGVIWWLRSDAYHPAFCLVEGRQVDYAESAKQARDLGVSQPGAGGAQLEPLLPRLIGGTLLGAAGGLLAGLLLGLGEALVVLALAGPGEDAQVLWYAFVLYGVVAAAIGAGAGAVLGVLPLPSAALDRWGAPLAFVAGFLPLGLAVTLFRLQRDVYLEQRPPLGVMLAVLVAGFLLAAVLGWALARVFRPAPEGRRLSTRAFRFAGAGALWLLVIALGALGAAALAPEGLPVSEARRELPADLAERPNVVLVVVDTLRADHLGAYGDKRGLTPSLDALAKRGTAYETFGQSSWTKPSVATILTSLYASSHGAMSKPSILPDVATLADVFRENGYKTAGFVSNINLAPSFNFHQGFDEYSYFAPDYLFGAAESSSKLVLYSILRKVWLTANKSRWVNQYYQDSRTVNGAVLPWLERHKDDRFFALVHYMDPHDPYFRHPYDGHGIARVETPNPPAERAAEMLELYAGEVRHMDESMGALVAQLEKLGLMDDTLLVVTADHGEEFHDHGGWWHGTTLYDEQIGVPLVIRWPRSIAVPQATGTARLLDVAPTILSAAGIERPESWQGADLREGVPSDRMLFAEEDHEGNVLTAARLGERKLIRANQGNPRGLPEVELFDLEEDRREATNLAEGNPEEVAELERLMADVGALATGGAAEGGGEVKMDDATRERLRALGYIQ